MPSSSTGSGTVLATCVPTASLPPNAATIDSAATAMGAKLAAETTARRPAMTNSTEFDVPLPGSACVYCGNCIAVCPTGALEGKIAWDMKEAGSWDQARQKVTRTVCSYCGVGCNLDVHTQDGRIVDVRSPLDHEVTLGNLCIKGRFGWMYVHSGVEPSTEEGVEDALL